MVKAREWQCSTCGQLQPVDDGGRGWAGEKCPPCQRVASSAYQQKRYQQKKNDKKFVESKRARYREWYHRQKGESAPAGVLQGAQAAPTPTIAPVVPSPRDSAAVRAYVLAMAGAGWTPEQIKDVSGYALGQVESVIRAELRRREREEQGDASP